MSDTSDGKVSTVNPQRGLLYLVCKCVYLSVTTFSATTRNETKQ